MSDLGPRIPRPKSAPGAGAMTHKKRAVGIGAGPRRYRLNLPPTWRLASECLPCMQAFNFTPSLLLHHLHIVIHSRLCVFHTFSTCCMPERVSSSCAWCKACYVALMCVPCSLRSIQLSDKMLYYISWHPIQPSDEQPGDCCELNSFIDLKEHASRLGEDDDFWPTK
jgi:hypothetical protein